MSDDGRQQMISALMGRGGDVSVPGYWLNPSNIPGLLAMSGGVPGLLAAGPGLLNNPDVSNWLQQRHAQDFGTPSAGGAMRDVLMAANLLPIGRAGAFRPYQNAPDSLMGFRRNGQNVGFSESNYKYELPVTVDFGDGNVFTDSIKGMNKAHAFERAHRNWPGATITIGETSP